MIAQLSLRGTKSRGNLIRLLHSFHSLAMTLFNSISFESVNICVNLCQNKNEIPNGNEIRLLRLSVLRNDFSLPCHCESASVILGGCSNLTKRCKITRRSYEKAYSYHFS